MSSCPRRRVSLPFAARRPAVRGERAPAWPTQPNQTLTDGGVTWQSFVKKANLIMSLATATGASPRIRSTSRPATSDTLPTGHGYDSFRFAEIGEVTQ